MCPKACLCQAPCWAFNSQGRQGSLQHRPWPLGAKFGEIGAQKAVPCIGEQQREQESQRPREKPVESSSGKAPRGRDFEWGGGWWWWLISAAERMGQGTAEQRV